MINASSIVQSILNGNLPVATLLRDLEALHEFSSGKVNYNLIVNLVMGMGCRLVIRNDGTIAAVPADRVVEPNPPQYMRTKTYGDIQFVKGEPFRLIDSVYPYIFRRLEILLQGSGRPLVAAPVRDVVELDAILRKHENGSAFVPYMVTIPVQCCTSGEIKLARVTMHALLQAREILQSPTLIISGARAKRAIRHSAMAFEPPVSIADAVNQFASALETVSDDYQQESMFSVEHALTLRNVLDVRKRDPEAVQQALLSVHIESPANAPKAPASKPRPKGRQ